jgi:mevalonate kinase
VAKQLSKQFAPGKVIISGEHSVVYGYPALTTSLSIGTTVEITNKSFSDSEAENKTNDSPSSRYFFRQDGQILPSNPILTSSLHIFQQHTNTVLEEPLWCEVTTQLPIGAGLGSSSALAAACIKALAALAGMSLSDQNLANLVWDVERTRYTLASPIDAFTVSRPGVWQFIKDDSWQSYPLGEMESQFPHMLLINSGSPQESTAEMVAQVGAFIAGNTQAKRVLKKLGDLVVEYIVALQQNMPLEQLIKENHQLLSKLPVVSSTALSMINSIEAVGGAAKITGAGGVQAGSGMILAYHQDISRLLSLCNQYNWEYLSLA